MAVDLRMRCVLACAFAPLPVFYSQQQQYIGDNNAVANERSKGYFTTVASIVFYIIYIFLLYSFYFFLFFSSFLFLRNNKT